MLMAALELWKCMSMPSVTCRNVQMILETSNHMNKRSIQSEGSRDSVIIRALQYRAGLDVSFFSNGRKHKEDYYMKQKTKKEQVTHSATATLIAQKIPKN